MKELPKKNGFNTPPGYFDSLADRILEKMEAQDKEGLPKTKGFTVPKGYFEQVEKDILSKVQKEETPVISLKNYKAYFYAAAAVAAVIVLVIGLQWNKEDALSFDDLAQVEISEYIESGDLEMSTYEIAEVIPVNNLEIDDFMDTAVDREQIMDYLEDSIDDLDELNIDLDEEF